MSQNTSSVDYSDGNSNQSVSSIDDESSLSTLSGDNSNENKNQQPNKQEEKEEEEVKSDEESSDLSGDEDDDVEEDDHNGKVIGQEDEDESDEEEKESSDFSDDNEEDVKELDSSELLEEEENKKNDNNNNNENEEKPVVEGKETKIDNLLPKDEAKMTTLPIEITELQRKRLKEYDGTIVDYYLKLKEFGNKCILEHKKVIAFKYFDTKERDVTIVEYVRNIKKYAKSFMKQTYDGIDKYSIVICMNNCPEAFWISVGAMLAKKPVVFINPNIPTIIKKKIIAESNSRFVFVDTEQLEDVKLITETLPTTAVLIGSDIGKGDSKLMSYTSFIEVAEEVSNEELEEVYKTIKPDDICEITFNPSDDDGNYYGSIWTHGNIKAQVDSLYAAMSPSIKSVGNEFTYTHYLPNGYFAERIVSLYLQLKVATKIIILCHKEASLSGDKLIEIMQKEKPTIFFGLPRIYEKLLSTTTRCIDESSKSKMFKGFAANRGVKSVKLEEEGKRKPKGYGVSRKIVYNTAMKSVGLEHCKFIFTNGIMKEAVREGLLKLGIKVYEGLALPETTGFFLLNRGKKCMPGTYGLPMKRVHLKLNKNVLRISGPTVTCGYLNKETKDRYHEKTYIPRILFTTEVSSSTALEYIKFIGFKDNIIQLTTGEVIYCNEIQKYLKLIPCVDEAIVVGTNQKFISVLISVNYEKVKEELGSKCPDEKSLKKDAYFGTYIRQRIEKINKYLPKPHHIKKFAIVDLSKSKQYIQNMTYQTRVSIEKKFETGISKFYEPPKPETKK